MFSIRDSPIEVTRLHHSPAEQSVAVITAATTRSRLRSALRMMVGDLQLVGDPVALPVLEQ